MPTVGNNLLLSCSQGHEVYPGAVLHPFLPVAESGAILTQGRDSGGHFEMGTLGSEVGGPNPISRASFSGRFNGTWQFTCITYPFAKAETVRACFSKDRRREMEFYGAAELSDAQGDPKCPYHFRRVFWMSLIR